MKPLDQVVRDRIAPVLKEFGFERRGRSFWLETAPGDLAVVEVAQFKLARHDAEFFVGMGVQPKVWADFVGRGGDTTRETLWADRLLVPGKQPPLADLWSFDLADQAAADLLVDSLVAKLPELMDMLDPDGLLAYARTLPHVGRRISVRPEIARAALLAQCGHLDELEQRLRELSEDRGDGWDDRDFVNFIRAWTASKGAGSV
ncbi:hypothetical protein [Nocardioides ultimimeridianus]